MKVLITRQIPNAGIRLLKEHPELELDYRQGPPLSKVVSINCTLNDKTRHLIDEAQLRKMKPTAILINTARGPVINEKTLIRALQEKWIGGAGLDVFEQEPEVPKELRELENAVLTPHIASATREARIQMATMAAKNVIAVLIDNKEPINQVKARAAK